MDLSLVPLEFPEGANIILGQSHFIKTVEDIYEIMVSSVPGAKFGVAFCEASGPCLIRVEGNDEKLKGLAAQNAQTVGAGHSFVVLLEKAFPVNILNQLKNCQEVCRLFCATANPVKVIIAADGNGRGILGVIDGEKPKGIEGEADIKHRKEFLRKIGYKL